LIKDHHLRTGRSESRQEESQLDHNNCYSKLHKRSFYGDEREITMAFATQITILCLIATWLSSPVKCKTYEPAIILEEVGVVFHPIGRLITSQDRLFIHIAITRPTHQTIPAYLSIHTECNPQIDNDQDESMRQHLRSICMEFYNAVMIYNDTTNAITGLIDDKLEDINISLESLPKMEHRTSKRPKRFVTAVIGLIKGAVDIGMSIHTNRRIDSLMASVKDLESESQKEKNVIQRLAEDSITIRKSIIETSKNMIARMNKLSNNINNEVLNLNNNLAMLIREVEMFKNDVMKTNIALARMAGPYTALLNRAVQRVNSYHLQIARFADGVATMARGFLSPDLIPPRILNEVLEETDRELRNERFTTLELVKILLTEHYNRQNVVFAVTEKHIIVQLELLLTHHNSRVYKLFRIETIPVPFDTSSGTNDAQPHTQLVARTPFFAVNKEYYTSVTNQQYSLCTVNADTTICPTLLLETNINHPSCLSSIWTGARTNEFNYRRMNLTTCTKSNQAHKLSTQVPQY
jgi:hypothetical protein